ncbi:MAG TPA: branched-chain amino acid ABC transporter permease [Limnochordales bacterium]|nr:branched-chain amino acid ABC transporter permease [Limnochordales bacterium]
MQLIQRYEEEMALVRGWTGWGGVALLAAALVGAPRVLQGYQLYIANVIGIKIIVAIGLNLLVGYTGQISLGHVGFVAVGAYAATHFVTAAQQWPFIQWLGGPFWLALLVAGAAAALFGVLVGLPALRLEGPYLAIVTLGFGLAVQQILINWPAVSGGRMGLFVPTPRIGPWWLDSDRSLYYLVWTCVVLLSLAAFNLSRSHVGRAFVALRDSDIAAEVTGVNLRLYKTLAFAVSAFYAGLAGGLLAYVIMYLEPTMFNLYESIYYLAMVVVGGLGTVPGSMFGAMLLTLMEFGLSQFQEYLPIVYGGTVILVMALEPMGLYGRWLKIKRWGQTWPL